MLSGDNVEKKNKTLTRQKVLMYVLFFLTFGIMMAVGTYRDLEIDKALFNYQSSFALFFENYGMLPYSALKLFAFCVLIVSYHKVDDALDIAQSFLPFINKLREIQLFKKAAFIIHHIIYAGFIYEAFIGSDELLNALMLPTAGGNLQDVMTEHGSPKFFAVLLWTILRIAGVTVALLLLRRVDKEKLKALEFMAVTGLIMYEGMEIILVIKDHFHRVRFREMVAYSHALINEYGMSYRGEADMPKEWVQSTDFYAYTPWYKVGNDYGVYSESNSFPSGHTAAGALIMLLPMLSSKTKKAEKLFLPSFLFSFAYLITLGITRLIRGAHYMTDIAAAAIIMFTLLLVIMFILNGIERYSQKKLRRIYRRRERDKQRQIREVNDD